LRVKRPKQQDEKPRSEPEIIPPDRARKRMTRDTPEVRIFLGTREAEHVYVASVRPLGAVLVILIVGLLSAVMLILLLSTVLIWLPFVAIVAAASIIAALWRRCFQSLAFPTEPGEKS